MNAPSGTQAFTVQGNEKLDPPVPAPALAHYREGLRLHRAKDLHGALRHLQASLQAAGEHPGIFLALARVAEDGGDLRAAEQLLRHVQGKFPSLPAAERLARLVYKQQRYAEAVTLLDALLPKLPFNPGLMGILSSALECTGEFERSRTLREQVLEKVPSAEHAGELATALMRHADYARLDARLPQWLARWPRDLGLLGSAAVWYLGSGDYPRGFSYMRQRLKLLHIVHGDPRVAACATWDGQPFAGTLLASLEPMVGDELMMSSLLLRVVAMGQATVAEVDARCLALYRRSFPGIEFVDRAGRELGDRIQAGGVCRHALTLDLLQGLHREWTLPGTPGWLRPEPDLVRRKREEYRARWPGKRLVGLSWRSRQHYNGIDAKSVPLSALVSTLALPDTQFINLQYGDTQAETAALQGLPVPWRDAEIDPFSDIEGLSAQVAALDQVVTVSNVTAHVAGATGVPTTVLLPKRFPVLWHWGLLGEQFDYQTTWYGAVRSLRNPEDAGFAALDRLLAADLAGPRRYAGPDSRQEIR